MTPPSKKLVEAVMGRKIGEVHLNGTDLTIYPESGIARSIINSYMFMHIMKEWAHNKKYEIWSAISEGEGVSHIHASNTTFKCNTEFEAVAQACEWILKEKS